MLNISQEMTISNNPFLVKDITISNYRKCYSTFVTFDKHSFNLAFNI